MPADLASLMKHAPTVAGGFIGRNQANDEQMADLREMELAQLMGHRSQDQTMKAARHPLELEGLRLGNETTSAQLPGVKANSSKLATDAEIAEATKGSKIGSTNMENDSKMMMGAISQMGPFIDILEGKAPAERHIETDGLLRGMGVPDNIRERLNKKFGSIPADHLPAALRKLHSAVLRNSPAHAQAMDKEELQQKGATERSKILAQSREDVAATRSAGGGKGGGKGSATSDDPTELLAWISGELKGKSPVTRLGILNSWISRTDDKPEVQQSLIKEAQAIAATVQSLPNAQPRPGQPDMSQLGGIPTNPVATPYVAPGAQQTPAQQPPAQPNLPKTLAEAQKMYPGVDPKLIRERIKNKYGVDLK